MKATDKDTGTSGSLTYSIYAAGSVPTINIPFSIDLNTGVIRTNREIMYVCMYVCLHINNRLHLAPKYARIFVPGEGRNSIDSTFQTILKILCRICDDHNFSTLICTKTYISFGFTLNSVIKRDRLFRCPAILNY